MKLLPYCKDMLNKPIGETLEVVLVKTLKQYIEYTNLSVKIFKQKKCCFLVRLIDYIFSNYCCYLVVISGEVSGLFCISVEPNEDFVCVYDVGLCASKRGCGFGRKLLRTIESICYEKGRMSIGLEVREDNSSALELYKSEGFYALDE